MTERRFKMRRVTLLAIAGLLYILPRPEAQSQSTNAGPDPDAEYEQFVTPALAATVAYERGNWDVAIKYYTKAIEDKSTDEHAATNHREMIARCYFHKKDTAKALSLLEDLEKGARASTTVYENGQKQSTTGLCGVYGLRGEIMYSLKRYKEAIECYKQARDLFCKLHDERRPRPEENRELLKEEQRLSYGLRIADCSLEAGQPAESVAEMFRQLQGRYEAIQKDESAQYKGYCQFLSRVYLKKRIGDCLHDRSHYKAALESYPAAPGDFTRKLLSADGYFLKKETLDALSRGIPEPKSSDQETTTTKDVTTGTLKVVGGCGSGCGSGAETASAQSAAKPAGSSASSGGCGCGSPQPAAKPAESSAGGGGCGCGSAQPVANPAPREAAK
jgi:tetratricopeptide (TPR) repeat protein